MRITMKIVSLLLLSTCIFYEKGAALNKKTEKILYEYNGFAKNIGSAYTLDAIRGKIVGGSEYIIIIKLNTHPIALEAMIASNGKGSHFLYLSSATSRVVSCTTERDAIDLRLVNNKKLSKIASASEKPIHPFFTLVETKKVGGAVNLFAFDSFDEMELINEIARLERNIAVSMLSNCDDYTVDKLRLR